jgi:O-methyltransferase
MRAKSIRRRDLLRYYWLQRKYRNYTMRRGKSYVANLALIDWWRRRETIADGIIVECGTWRGGMSFSMADLCPEAAEIHCFDSFEGLPPTGELDGEEARRGYEESAFVAGRNFASLDEFTAGQLLLAPHKRDKVKPHKGWFEDTIPAFRTDKPIKILRLDGDWYESTMTCLENLYDLCAPNALVIIDDYVAWEGCARAVHDFLSRRQLPCRIREFLGVTYLLKV